VSYTRHHAARSAIRSLTLPPYATSLTAVAAGQGDYLVTTVPALVTKYFFTSDALAAAEEVGNIETPEGDAEEMQE